MKDGKKEIIVYGAYGHTGRFVVAELVRMGHYPVLSGRSAHKLNLLASLYPELEIRPASVNDADAMDDALSGAIVVINCAGPFLDTATPVIEAALRNSVHYIDMAAEQHCVLSIYEQFAKESVAKGIVILPGMAFFGGLADLLATAAMGDWVNADTIEIGVALDSWMPTVGTRLTGQRNTGPRLTFSNKTLVPVSDPLPLRKWQFEEPFGSQDMVSFPLTEIITISKHLDIKEINTYMNVVALQDIHNSATPPPIAADDKGRSSQIFIMEAIVRSGAKQRRALATGRDIYAITAPLIAEAAIRVKEGLFSKKGVVSAAEIFDAANFLNSLCLEHLLIDAQAD